MKKLLMVLGVVGAMAAVGCGSPVAGSCTSSTSGGNMSCVEYDNGYSADQARGLCTTSSGTFTTSACPTTNRVGHCVNTLTLGPSTLTSTTSYYPPMTAAEAMAACTSGSGLGGGSGQFFAN